MTKKEKIGALITAIWGLLVWIFARIEYADMLTTLAAFWALPVLIGWGIYWIKRNP
jgi:hypothetical protein